MKPGPPRRYGRRWNLTCRLTKQTYARLQAAARGQGRSLSEEIEVRLTESFQREDLSRLIEAAVRRALNPSTQ